MLYLVQKYDINGRISYPFDTDKYWEVVEWLMWMQSGIGPMQVTYISSCSASKQPSELEVPKALWKIV